MTSLGTRAVCLAAVLTGCSATPPPAEPLVADPPAAADGTAESADAKTALGRGVAFLKNDKPDEAKVELEKSMANKPSAEAAFYLGVVGEKKGDKKAAEAMYRRALELDGAFAEASENLAAIFLDEPPRPDQAIPVLTEALAKSPGNARLLQNLGYAYALKKDVENASKYYEAAIKKQDDFQLRFAYGTILFESKQGAKAAEQLKKALEGAPDDAPVLVTLGRMLGASKGYAECVRAFDRALKLKATDPEWFVRRGTCRHELKDEPGAQADFEQAIKVDEKFAPAHYYLGLSLAEQGKDYPASRALEKAMIVGKGSPIAKLAKDKIDAMRKKKK